MSTKKQNAEQEIPPVDNVEQIREILFGGHIRAFDERFETVEKRLLKKSDSLKQTLHGQISELEKLLQKFRDDAGDQLNHEGAQRDAGINKLNESLTAFRLDTENQLAELQSEFSAETKQVRQELDTVHKALMDELNSMHTTHTKRWDGLDDSKVDRGELAGFLNDVAGRLAPVSKKRSK